MKRLIEDDITAWIKRGTRKPLVIFGARQTGKTTTVLECGRRMFKHVLHIDFYKQSKYKAAFGDDLSPESVLLTLEALSGQSIHPGETLLFLDEIQDCDGALTALKYFCSDMPDLHVIAAGSLLGVHVAREGSFPVGYVEMLTMHPMNFEEFCGALGEDRAFALARRSMDGMMACPLHERLMSMYKSYLLVGGMPEAVKAHCSGEPFAEVRRIQREIQTAYVADMTKYATSADSAKILSCWESIPAQLAKESDSTKFAWKLVARGARADRYGTALDWLKAAGLVSLCTQVSDGVSPLKSFENKASFKAYMVDTGLLSCSFDAQPEDFDDKGPRSARFRGGMAENYVMQQLVSANHVPYYWGTTSTYEVEFVTRLGEDGVIPVEVKSGTRTQSPSLKKYADKYNPRYVVRVSAKNFGYESSVKSIPLYAACLL